MKKYKKINAKDGNMILIKQKMRYTRFSGHEDGMDFHIIIPNPDVY